MKLDFSRLCCGTLSACVIAMLFSGCGPTVKIAPELAQHRPRMVALLPPHVPSDMPRERGDAVRDIVASELKSSGFILIDQKVVSAICADAECAGRGQLVSRYGVDGFFDLTIDSSSRTNFLAGYYNSLSGNLKLNSREGKELFSVVHTESERGGLIFNSGQLLQGLKSQYKNSGDESFGVLAEKFARSLAEQLPAASESESTSLKEGPGVSVTSVDLRAVRAPLYEICANATPRSMASVIFGARRTNLRETRSGRYCGLYRLDDAVGSTRQPVVEVRSAYGDSASRELGNVAVSTCSLDGLVLTSAVGNKPSVSLSCVDIAGRDKAGESCGAETSSCSVSKFLVYKGLSDIGPFRKVGESERATWVDPETAAATKPIYEVLGVNKTGIVSVPVRAKPSA